MSKKKKRELKFQKRLGYSIFSFSDLDLAWLNYKNSPIFIQKQNKSFRFALQRT